MFHASIAPLLQPFCHWQDGAWRDVTFGADMALSSHLAAWAALSQAENTTTGANYLYVMGVSANF